AGGAKANDEGAGPWASVDSRGSPPGLLPGLAGQDPEHVTHGWHLPVTPADEVGDHPGPAGLVGGAQPRAVVAVEVLVEHEVVLPRRVVLQPRDLPEARPTAVRPSQEQGDEPVGQVGRDGVQREPAAGTGRVLYRQLVAEEP